MINGYLSTTDNTNPERHTVPLVMDHCASRRAGAGRESIYSTAMNNCLSTITPPKSTYFRPQSIGLYKETKAPPTTTKAMVRPLMAISPWPAVNWGGVADAVPVAPVPDECGAVAVTEPVPL
jgi:hypothetical protein